MWVASCASTQTKIDAYPAMYDNRQPVSIIVIPAINQSTAAEASDYFNVTITEPLSNTGYYTMPVEIVRDIFLKEGIVDSAMIKGIPTSVFKKNFGADAVLFVTIKSWDKNYAVFAGNVQVRVPEGCFNLARDPTAGLRILVYSSCLAGILIEAK